jgi:hypothetical protein
MAEKNPSHIAAWSSSFSDIQGLPKVMRRVLQQALATGNDDPGKFLVSMGRLLRFCDIGTPCRRRARLAAAAVLSRSAGMESGLKRSQEISLVFSSAFRAVRYRERHVWSEAMSPGLAIVLARDDLESLWQAIRRSVPVPDLVRDPFRAHDLLQLRLEVEDHIQTVDALHDNAVDALVAHDLARHQAGQEDEFLLSLAPVEAVRWWLAVYWLNTVRNPPSG